MKTLLLSLSLLLSGLAFSQQSFTLSGTVWDSESGETLPFANVAIKQNQAILTGVSTDFDGNFSINVDAGVYAIECSYVGIATMRIENFRLTKNSSLNISMGNQASVTGLPPQASLERVARIATLQGVVYEDRKTLEGAEVYLWAKDKTLRKVLSDPDGNYLLSNLYPGYYDVSVSYPDGTESGWEHIYLPAEKAQRLDFDKEATKER